MSLGQITLGRLKAHGVEGKLNVEKMPITGYLYTHCADNLITDSAAGATELSTGFKTNKGMIGVLPDSTAVLTLLEYFRDNGKATGMVVTSSITHATPAGFAAHVPYRKQETEIAEQLVDSNIDVLLGGGKQFFLPQEDTLSVRKDSRNLIAEAQKKGYQFVDTRDKLLRVKKTRVLGLFQKDGLEHKPEEPTLAEMTEKALSLLTEDPDGFFLMVEGSQIDWGGHRNDPDYVAEEMLGFDKAIKVALEFARKEGNTLVIVTADHETGGLSITGGKKNGKNLEVRWTSTYHTAMPVPIFAYGPYSDEFSGVHDNTEVPRIIARIMGIDNFPRKLNYRVTASGKKQNGHN